MPATVNDGLWGTPATRHEAACASGSVAALAAIADLRSGAYRTALVVGIELEKTVPGDTATAILGAAAWTGHEGAGREVHVAAHVRQRRRRVRPALRPRRLPSACHRGAELRQRAREQPQRPDARLGGPRSADRRRRAANPVDRGPASPLRLQPDHRRRRRRRAGHRRLAARPSRTRGHSGGSTAGATAPSAWGCGRSWTARRGRRRIRAAARAQGRARRLRPRARHPRRRRRVRGARLLHARANTWRSTTSG